MKVSKETSAKHRDELLNAGKPAVPRARLRQGGDRRDRCGRRPHARGFLHALPSKEVLCAEVMARRLGDTPRRRHGSQA